MKRSEAVSALGIGWYDYVDWLAALVDIDLARYEELIDTLAEMDFIYVLELDASRCADGLRLREEFFDIDPLAGEWIRMMDKPASVLEVLIGIARRFDDILIDEDVGDRTRLWFWEFIKNLGITQFSTEFDIQMIIERWMNREFDENGNGSIFPIKRDPHDQRERSIIYQMSSYIFEKYEDELED